MEDNRKVENTLLDISGEQEEIGNLRHPRSRNADQLSRLGPVTDLAGADHPVDTVSEREQAGHARDATDEEFL